MIERVGIEDLSIAVLVLLWILDHMKGLIPKIVIRNNGEQKNSVPSLSGSRPTDPDRTIVVQESLEKQLGRMFSYIEKQNGKQDKLIEDINSKLDEQTQAIKELVKVQMKTNQYLENRREY